jgi:ribosomal protein S18 acetylase RimI-like enzyme
MINMHGALSLIEATTEHYPFALGLYLETMQPITEQLMSWNEPKQRESFGAQWKLEEARIIREAENNVGWLQIAESPSDIRLQQFFVVPSRQNNGIGTAVLRRLLAEWRRSRKPVVLTVLKNNPARRLYERVGFSVTGEIGVKFEMRPCA